MFSKYTGNFKPDRVLNLSYGIKSIDISLTAETSKMIIGAILVNSIKSPENTVVGKVFIYKNEHPVFIEVNIDESYIEYLFEEPAGASYEIANFVLNILTIYYPGALLNMESSIDIGCIRLPLSIKKHK